jgi:type I restriction enzyme M protein
VDNVSAELDALYADPDELLKHARVVGLDEIEENEFNLNIPRYVDTWEGSHKVFTIQPGIDDTSCAR